MASAQQLIIPALPSGLWNGTAVTNTEMVLPIIVFLLKMVLLVGTVLLLLRF
jgi:hypothetical protein